METTAVPRDRDVEAAKARAKNAKRLGRGDKTSGDDTLFDPSDQIGPPAIRAGRGQPAQQS